MRHWLIATLFCLISSPVFSQTFNEKSIGDAGEFPGGTFATNTSATTYNRIIGNAIDGIDSWLITVTNSNTFFLEDVSFSDTTAYVWDLAGNPLFSNDDSAGFFNLRGFGFGHGGNHPGNILGDPAILSDGDQIVVSVGGFGGDPVDFVNNPIFIDDGNDFKALAGPNVGPGPFSAYTGSGFFYEIELTGAIFGTLTLLGDVNLDGVVDLLDVAPFVALISSGGYQLEADINEDGVVDLLDVNPFVDLLTG